MKELSEEEALNKSMILCSRSEHCTTEITTKLIRWGISDPTIQERIIEKLKEEGFINDERFCRAYVFDKFKFNHWGRAKISCMLKMKGLPEIAITQALEAIKDDDARQEALRLLTTKYNKLHYENSYEAYAKLMRYAYSRGIETDIAAEIISQLVK